MTSATEIQQLTTVARQMAAELRRDPQFKMLEDLKTVRAMATRLGLNTAPAKPSDWRRSPFAGYKARPWPAVMTGMTEAWGCTWQYGIVSRKGTNLVSHLNRQPSYTGLASIPTSYRHLENDVRGWVIEERDDGQKRYAHFLFDAPKNQDEQRMIADVYAGRVAPSLHFDVREDGTWYVGEIGVTDTPAHPSARFIQVGPYR